MRMFLKQNKRKRLDKNRAQFPGGLVGDTNMAALTSGENALYKIVRFKGGEHASSESFLSASSVQTCISSSFSLSRECLMVASLLKTRLKRHAMSRCLSR